MSEQHPLQLLVERLARRAVLDEHDRLALRALPCTERTYQTSAYLVREGEPPRPTCSLITSGFAFRQKLTVEGTRQIVSLHMRGDLIDLQHLFLNCADHNVQALTVVQTCNVDREALQEMILTRPAIARALWIDVLVDSSVFREWIVNVGRRSARERIAHLICEFSVRMRAAMIAGEDGYVLPMTQEQLGDSLGLTSVHVNRMLKSLVDDGLIRFDRRHLTILDWEGIKRLAAFSELYLHLDQVAPEIAKV